MASSPSKVGPPNFRARARQHVIPCLMKNWNRWGQSTGPRQAGMKRTNSLDIRGEAGPCPNLFEVESSRRTYSTHKDAIASGDLW